MKGRKHARQTKVFESWAAAGSGIVTVLVNDVAVKATEEKPPYVNTPVVAFLVRIAYSTVHAINGFLRVHRAS